MGSRLECRPPTTWQQSQPSSSLESAPAVRSLHCSWFNAIAFSVAAIPLVSFAIAPDATRARIDQLYNWVSTHQRLVVTVLASLVGIYLIVVGISKL